MTETPETKERAAAPSGAEQEAVRLADELARTRTALAACEEQLRELRSQRSATMALLERKAYWLERLDIDLDAFMSRRPVRLAYTALRFLRRSWRRLRSKS